AIIVVRIRSRFSGETIELILPLNDDVQKQHNAALSGEQRRPPDLKYCTVNTKFEVDTKMPSVGNPS
ncbi:hypothetical protein DS893_00305, partial [Vibrionales bacterium C3R12]